MFSVTEAQRLRQEHIQQAAQKVKIERMRREEEKKLKQKEMSRLQKQVAKKTAAHDPMRYREKETAQKLATFKYVRFFLVILETQNSKTRTRIAHDSMQSWVFLLKFPAVKSVYAI